MTDRHEAVNDALDVLSSLALENGRLWGDAAENFQWSEAAGVLDLESHVPYHFLTRARGSSKTSDLAGIALAAMLTQLPGGARCYALPSDRDQGRLLLDAVEGYIARTPMLEGAFEIGACRVTSLVNGATLDVLAADAPGAWGLRPAFVIVDELAQWQSTSAPRRLWEAVASAVAKMPDARLVVLPTAGDPAHWSRKVLDHALVDPMWRVNEVHGPALWMNEKRLAEQKRRLPEASYMRLSRTSGLPAKISSPALRTSEPASRSTDFRNLSQAVATLLGSMLASNTTAQWPAPPDGPSGK